MDASSLPTTAIGLIAFTIVACGLALKYMADNNRKTIEIFMTYIEKKNGNLEKATELFTETTKERDKEFQTMLEDNNKKHDDILIEQNRQHKEILSDAVAQISSLADKK